MPKDFLRPVLGLDEALKHFSEYAIVAVGLGLIVSNCNSVGGRIGDHYSHAGRFEHGHVVGRVTTGDGVGDIDAETCGKLAQSRSLVHASWVELVVAA